MSSNYSSCELNLLHTNMPNGIYYDNKIYWEISTTSDSVNAEKIGDLKKVANPNILPTSDFMGTNGLNQYVGMNLYKDGNTIYLKVNDEFLILQYIDLSKEDTSEENFNISKSDEYAIPLHFNFNKMTYQSYQGEEIELPDCFKEKGTIKRNVFRASEDFTGNVPEGSTVYTTDFQNRFIILKNKTDNKYYLFENTSYNHDR